MDRTFVAYVLALALSPLPIIELPVEAATPALQQAAAAMELCDFGKVKALLGSTNTVPALLLVAQAYQGAESTDGKPFLLKAQKLEPNNSAVLTGLAWVNLREKNYDDCQKQLEQAIKISPTNEEAAAMLGRCAYKNGDKDKGLKLLKATLEKSPASLSAHLELAKTYIDEKQQDKAVELLTDAIKRYPKNVLPLLKRAAVYSDQNKDDAAFADLNKALSLNPRCQAALSLRARMQMDKKQYEKALADCKECMDQAQGMDNIKRKCMRTKVKCEEKLGKNTAAVSDLQYLTRDVEKTQKWTGGSEEAYIKLTANYEKLKKYDDALKSLAVIERFVPGSTEAMGYKARILSKMGRDKESLAVYDKMLATNNGIADWHADRAKVEQKLGQSAAAEKDLQAAKDLRH